MVKQLTDVDFGAQAYRGYLIRKNALNGLMWIEKDGYLIGYVHDVKWSTARSDIDKLLD